METRSIDTVSFDEVKSILRQLVHSGVSYSHICDEDEISKYWNSNQLKQFVNRKSVPRNTPAMHVLTEGVFRIVRRQSDSFINLPTIRAFLNKNSTYTDGNEGKINVDEFFDVVNSFGNVVKLPETLCYCRYSLDGNYILSIKIDVIEQRDRSYFSMKISGQNNKRRVVVGSISGSPKNMCFTGVAFGVSKFATEKQILEINYSNPEIRGKILSSNPIGAEMFTLSNVNLFDEYFPVCFTGLDGKGDPISGRAVIFGSEALESEYLENQFMSKITCADANQDKNISNNIIRNAMKELKAITIPLDCKLSMKMDSNGMSTDC